MHILAVKLWYLVSKPNVITEEEARPSATLDFLYYNVKLQNQLGETTTMARSNPNPSNYPFVSRKVIIQENCMVAFTLTPSTHTPTCNWVELRHSGSIVNTPPV